MDKLDIMLSDSHKSGAKLRIIFRTAIIFVLFFVKNEHYIYNFCGLLGREAGILGYGSRICLDFCACSCAGVQRTVNNFRVNYISFPCK